MTEEETFEDKAAMINRTRIAANADIPMPTPLVAQMQASPQVDRRLDDAIALLHTLIIQVQQGHEEQAALHAKVDALMASSLPAQEA